MGATTTFRLPGWQRCSRPTFPRLGTSPITTGSSATWAARARGQWAGQTTARMAQCPTRPALASTLPICSARTLPTRWSSASRTARRATPCPCITRIVSGCSSWRRTSASCRCRTTRSSLGPTLSTGGSRSCTTRTILSSSTNATPSSTTRLVGRATPLPPRRPRPPLAGWTIRRPPRSATNDRAAPPTCALPLGAERCRRQFRPTTRIGVARGPTALPRPRRTRAPAR
mmetsp:Transcript_7844/g.25664  ORF Transcript_7844/g.25664 Transcript_7844/m.25664 type:complete len:229 (-) Transcript_7844:1075-1761(-)